MIEEFKQNKVLAAAVLIVGIGGVLAATQTNLINSVIGEGQSDDDSVDAMEAGQAMRAQENLGEESTDDSTDPGDSMNDSLNSTDSMNDSMMENESMSMEQ